MYMYLLTGFEKAHEVLHKIKEKFGDDFLSNADAIVLCGYVALEVMDGPRVPFSYGRLDFSPEQGIEKYGAATGGCPFGDGKFNPCGSRLPSADVGKREEYAEPRLREKPTIDAVRSTFQRMGFNDKETVCLIVLGHQFGRCHPEISGYQHPWYTFDPTHWNIYESGLGYLSTYIMGNYEEVLSSTGKRQFVMNFGGGEPFMMLISDMVLLWDHSFREHLLWYDKHRKDFRSDSAVVWKKLTELGCADMLTPEKAS
jgi:catalase (peroxidase I)